MASYMKHDATDNLSVPTECASHREFSFQIWRTATWLTLRSSIPLLLFVVASLFVIVFVVMFAAYWLSGEEAIYRYLRLNTNLVSFYTIICSSVYGCFITALVYNYHAHLLRHMPWALIRALRGALTATPSIVLATIFMLLLVGLPVYAGIALFDISLDSLVDPFPDDEGVNLPIALSALTALIPLVLLPFSFYAHEIANGRANSLSCIGQSVRLMLGRKRWFMMGLAPFFIAQYCLSTVIVGYWGGLATLSLAADNLIVMFSSETRGILLIVCQYLLYSWVGAVVSVMHQQAVNEDAALAGGEG